MDSPGLRRSLGLWDLVLLNVAAVVGMRWFSTAAQLGPSSMALWVLALLAYFIPVGLTVIELSARVPGQGGFYLWTKVAFGNVHGFLAGWIYWITNFFYFPSMLLFTAGVFLYVGGTHWLWLADNHLYNAGFCIGALWFATLLNVMGLERAKWLQNIGGIATVLLLLLLVVGGVMAWYRYGSASVYSASTLMPDVSTMFTWKNFALMAFAYTGLELAPIMGGEIRSPNRILPRAILISGVMIAFIYMAGTTTLLVALPAGQIDVITGIPQAMLAVGERAGWATVGIVGGALIFLSQIGGLGAWVGGTARLPFVVGVDRYLPAALGRLHPRYGSPHVALIAQAIVTTLVLCMALAGSTIREAFLLLVDMTVIATFLPLLYMFACLPVLRMRAAANDTTVNRVPGGKLGCWLVAASGFTVTLLAIIFAATPPADSADPGVYMLKVIGGTVLFIILGLFFYWRGCRAIARA